MVARVVGVRAAASRSTAGALRTARTATDSILRLPARSHASGAGGGPRTTLMAAIHPSNQELLDFCSFSVGRACRASVIRTFY